jgi:hypothetical protein
MKVRMFAPINKQAIEDPRKVVKELQVHAKYGILGGEFQLSFERGEMMTACGNYECG